MVSLTPGVLSKLLDNVGNKDVKVSGEHRSALLQVVEIVPWPGGGGGDKEDEEDPWNSWSWKSRPLGFFLKLSDSQHSAYVSVTDDDDDLDLIYSGKIQLGQLVYVTRLDSASPVPVLRGLKPVPKSKRPPSPSGSAPCLGNPNPIIHLIQNIAKKKPDHHGKPKPKPAAAKSALSSQTTNSNEGGGKSRKPVQVDTTRRLSLDSGRRAWDARTTSATTSSASHFKSKIMPAVVFDKKLSTENESPLRHPRLSVSPLKNKNKTLSPKPTNEPSKKESKSLPDETLPNHLIGVPLSFKPWSDQRISWNVLPSTISDLGKGAICHRNIAFVRAVRALEEASAAEGVIHCLCMFAELSKASHKVSAGPVVEKFLDFHQNMERAAMVVGSLLNTCYPDVKSGSSHGLEGCVLHVRKTSTGKNATSWVEAALGANLSRFSMFRAQGDDGIPNSEKYHHVVLEDTPANFNLDNYLPQNKQNSRLGRAVKKTITERDERSKDKRLKGTASLAEKLLFVSREWFLKYLEGSLNAGFRLNKEEGSSETARLLGQLKRVNLWLDDLVKGGIQVDERIKDLRKKLYGFLLEHVDSVVSSN